MLPSDYFNETYLRDYFKRNILKKKGGGRDNLTPEKYYEKHGNEFDTICQKCLDGSYRFSYYNEKLILRGSKKLPRVLSIPTVRDRLVLGVLNDYLSAVFPECVSHEIPNVLIRKVADYIENHKNEEIAFLRTDFHNFYGSLYVKLLMSMVGKKVHDRAMLELIYQAVITPTVAGNTPKVGKRPFWRGIPQGLAISNILASIYMHSFDEEFGSNRAGLFIRYVDDILFLGVRNSDLKEQMLSDLNRRNLKLKLSEAKCKSGIVGVDTMDFIGYVVGEKIYIRQKNVTLFLNRVASLSSKCKAGVNNPHLRPQFIKQDNAYYGFYIEEFNRMLSGFKYGNRLYGWLPYFQSITDVASLYGLDRVIKNKFLKGLPQKIASEVHSLVDTYYDIHRNGGNKLLENYDLIATITEKRNYLYRKGRLDPHGTYTEEQILNHFDSYMDLIRRVSEQNIGTTS